MSRVPILRAPLVGGSTVEWRLAEPDRAASEAVRTTEGLSFLQQDHVRACLEKRERGAPHTGTATSVTVFDEPLDRDAMAAALTLFTRRHEELRAMYPADEHGPFRAVAPAEATRYVTVEIGDAVAADDVLAHVIDRVVSEAHFDVMPGIIFGAVDDGNRFTFYTACDHSHTDGYSQFMGVAEIARLYRSIRDGGEPAAPTAGGFGDLIRAEAQVARSVDPGDPRVGIWREILSDHDRRVPGFPFDLGLADGELAPALPVQRVLADADHLAAIDARRAVDGASMAGVLYAALAAAQRELLGVERFFTATVLSTRSADTLDTQGWLCNFAPVAFAIPSGVAFGGLVATATAAVARARDLAGLPVHVVLALLAGDGSYVPTPGSPQMVSYIDFRRIPGNDDPALQKLTCFQAVGETKNANTWLTRYADHLVLDGHIPDNATARTSFDRYIDSIERWITAYAAGDDSEVLVGPPVQVST
ncbi:condensation domain-containing protein [Gordonia sp. PKS22-38]|uniref:Condensation domain-containing protein n=1 Tax=Gordonia prachuapensis TaxID=3115651 RepID=A0ABU7MQ74_9ACTN|nr:condensation domain-containing protein [Gordonia sp. PKS22-38]